MHYVAYIFLYIRPVVFDVPADRALRGQLMKKGKRHSDVVRRGAQWAELQRRAKHHLLLLSCADIIQKQNRSSLW